MGCDKIKAVDPYAGVIGARSGYRVYVKVNLENMYGFMNATSLKG